MPTLLFGFAAGVALDRVVLRRILILADLGRSAAFAALAVAIAADATEPWMVFTVAFAVGSLSVTFDSGLQAWMPSLLDDDRLVIVNTRLQFARTLAWTIGPPLAGFLVGTLGGFAVAFGVDAATFAISALFLLVLTELRSSAVMEPARWCESLRDGLRYLWNEPRLRSATLAAALVNLTFVPMEALLVLFASERLGVTDGRLIGWFFAGHAVIGALGVGLAPGLAKRIGLGRTFVLGLLLLGLGFLTLNLLAPRLASLAPGATTALAILPAGVAVTGVSFTNVAFTTLRQAITPPEYLGRVIAASRTLSWAGLPIGATLGGALGETVGLDVLYSTAAGLLIAIAVLLSASTLWKVTAGADASQPARSMSPPRPSTHGRIGADLHDRVRIQQARGPWPSA